METEYCRSPVGLFLHSDSYLLVAFTLIVATSTVKFSPEPSYLLLERSPTSYASPFVSSLFIGKAGSTEFHLH